MPLFLELHLHLLAARGAELLDSVGMLFPSDSALILLMKAKRSDTIAGDGTEGRKNSALTAGHGW